MTRTLVIDTATAACSVALFDGQEPVARDHALIGRGHAERLVPMIAALPGQGRADAVHVSVGPGSFTGIRVGIAAARALGLAWGAEVQGYPTLAAMAAGLAAEQSAMGRPDAAEMAILTIGGHGEFFVQLFDDGRAHPDWPEPRSLGPAEAAAAVAGRLVAGDAAGRIDLGGGAMLPLHPDAAGWPHFAELATLPPRALYGRGPDAALPKGAAA